MQNKTESGKSKLIKGTIWYLWEEMKTMNRSKIKALFAILSGLIKMKIGKQKVLKSRPIEFKKKEDQYLTW